MKSTNPSCIPFQYWKTFCLFIHLLSYFFICIHFPSANNLSVHVWFYLQRAIFSLNTAEQSNVQVRYVPKGHKKHAATCLCALFGRRAESRASHLPHNGIFDTRVMEFKGTHNVAQSGREASLYHG